MSFTSCFGLSDQLLLAVSMDTTAQCERILSQVTTQHFEMTEWSIKLQFAAVDSEAVSFGALCDWLNQIASGLQYSTREVVREEMERDRVTELKRWSM